jgi:hypothetical protein
VIYLLIKDLYFFAGFVSEESLDNGHTNIDSIEKERKFESCDQQKYEAGGLASSKKRDKRQTESRSESRREIMRARINTRRESKNAASNKKDPKKIETDHHNFHLVSNLAEYHMVPTKLKRDVKEV